jgi:hypothetical protein
MLYGLPTVSNKGEMYQMQQVQEETKHFFCLEMNEPGSEEVVFINPLDFKIAHPVKRNGGSPNPPSMVVGISEYSAKGILERCELSPIQVRLIRQGMPDFRITRFIRILLVRHNRNTRDWRKICRKRKNLLWTYL